jgi:hypothetical protein
VALALADRIPGDRFKSGSIPGAHGPRMLEKFGYVATLGVLLGQGRIALLMQ